MVSVRVMKHRRSIQLGAPAPELPPARLKWRRHDDGSFIAWPEGEALPDRYCRIAPHRMDGGNLSGSWTYVLAYNGERQNGLADDRQAAADTVSQRWPGFLQTLREKKASAHADAATRVRILAAANGPAIPIEALRLEDIDRALLLEIIKELPDGPVRLAISTEFHRRNVARRETLGLKGAFPSTAEEFERHERRVVIRCTACWTNTWIEPQALIQFLGRDGDVYQRLFTDLPQMVTCPKCNAPVREFFVVRVKDSPPYSFDERMMHEREFRAFVAARDSAAPKDPRAKPLKARRVRKFR